MAKGENKDNLADAAVELPFLQGGVRIFRESTGLRAP